MAAIVRFSVGITTLALLASASIAQGPPDVLWERGGSVAEPGAIAFAGDGTKLWTGGFYNVKSWTVPGLAHASTNTRGELLCFSPDGEKALHRDSGDPRKALVVRLSDNTVLATLTSASNVLSAAFSPASDRVATGHVDGRVRIWQSNGTFVAQTDAETCTIERLAYSPDGTRVASVGQNSTNIWRALDGVLDRGVGAGLGNPRALAYSTDGSRLAVALDHGEVNVYRTSDGTLVVSVTTRAAEVGFTPDGAYVATGSVDQHIRLWRLSSGRLERTLSGHPGGVTAMAFRSPGMLASSGADGAVRLWDWRTGTLLAETSGPDFSPTGPVFSEDGRWVAAASAGTLYVWRAADGTLWWQGPWAQAYYVGGVVFTPDSRGLAGASGSSTCSAIVARLADGDIVETYETGPVRISYACAVSPDGRLIGAVGANGVGLYRRWDGFAVTESGAAYGIGFSPNGTRLVAGGFTSVRIWDLVAGGPATEVATTRRVLDLSVDPNGGAFATGGYDGCEVHALSNGALLATVVGTGNACPAYTADGSGLWVGTDTALSLYRTTDGLLRRTYDQRLYGGVRSVASSPNGWLVAYGCADGTVVVARNPFPAYRWAVSGFTITPANRARLLWTDRDGMASVWTLGPAGAMDTGWTFGPYASWRAEGLSTGADGQAKVLWSRSDNSMSLWTLAAAGTIGSGFAFTRPDGDLARLIATGADNKTRIAWDAADGGVVITTVTTAGALESEWRFGPYPQWDLRDMAVGPDNRVRLLWQQLDGKASVWKLGATGLIEQGVAFGPYAVWNAEAISVGGDGKTRMLWKRYDGMASIWTLAADGSNESGYTFGPLASTQPAAIATGADNKTRLLWKRLDGRYTVQTVTAGGLSESSWNLGPY